MISLRARSLLLDVSTSELMISPPIKIVPICHAEFLSDLPMCLPCFLSPSGFHICHSLCQKHYSPSLHVAYSFELFFQAIFHDSLTTSQEALAISPKHVTPSSRGTYPSIVMACFRSCHQNASSREPKTVSCSQYSTNTLHIY